MDEFDDVQVEDKLHIIISVKDFRAILQHAHVISGDLTTCYSSPGRPMKLSYSADGVLCEFILVTLGEKDAIGQKHKNPRASAAAAKSAGPELDSGPHRSSLAATENQTSQAQQRTAQRKLPTQQKTPIRIRQPQFDIRPQPMALPPPATARSTRSDSLFVGQADDDQQWEPINPDDDEDEPEVDRLEWNSNNEPVYPYASSPVRTRNTDPRHRTHQRCVSTATRTCLPNQSLLRRTKVLTVWSLHNGSRRYVMLLVPGFTTDALLANPR